MLGLWHYGVASKSSARLNVVKFVWVSDKGLATSSARAMGAGCGAVRCRPPKANVLTCELEVRGHVGSCSRVCVIGGSRFVGTSAFPLRAMS